MATTTNPLGESPEMHLLRGTATMQRLSQRTKVYSSARMVLARNNRDENRSLVAPDYVRKTAKNPWTAVKDPKGSSLVYYWNKDTNETTALGAPKPEYWVEVTDPNGSSLTYWWNPDTDATTALGAPKPSAASLLQIQQQKQAPMQFQNPNDPQFQQLPPPTFGSTMKTYFALGLGMTFAIALVQSIF